MITPMFLSRLLAVAILTGASAVVQAMPRETAPAAAADTGAAAVGDTPAIDLGAFTSVDALLPVLAEKRVVLVGEDHTRYDHHLVQLEIIRGLHERDLPLAIGMEQFQQPFQRYLDDYIAGIIDEQEMLRATEYFRRWGMDYRLYAPILRFAREHRVPVVALNLAEEITSRVGRVGLQGLSEAERGTVPAEIDRSDNAYEQRLKMVFDQHPNDGQPFSNFLDVQLLWDEGMAARAADFLLANPDHRMVIIAGGRHVAYGSSIPWRLQRRAGVSMATILNSWPGPVEPGLADYLLMPSPRALPPAGRIGAVLDADDDKLRIAHCMEDSVCAQAGLRAGDHILSIDGQPIDSMADLRLVMWDKQPGDDIRVELQRRFLIFPGKTLSIDVILR
jgi:uncharacterized iron-regulated protein